MLLGSSLIANSTLVFDCCSRNRANIWKPVPRGQKHAYVDPFLCIVLLQFAAHCCSPSGISESSLKVQFFACSVALLEPAISSVDVFFRCWKRVITD